MKTGCPAGMADTRSYVAPVHAPPGEATLVEKRERKFHWQSGWAPSISSLPFISGIALVGQVSAGGEQVFTSLRRAPVMAQALQVLHVTGGSVDVPAGQL